MKFIAFVCAAVLLCISLGCGNDAGDRPSAGSGSEQAAESNRAEVQFAQANSSQAEPMPKPKSTPREPEESHDQRFAKHLVGRWSGKWILKRPAGLKTATTEGLIRMTVVMESQGVQANAKSRPRLNVVYRIQGWPWEPNVMFGGKEDTRPFSKADCVTWDCLLDHRWGGNNRPTEEDYYKVPITDYEVSFDANEPNRMAEFRFKVKFDQTGELLSGEVHVGTNSRCEIMLERQ